MSEENKNPELNDAALEGVSGGISVVYAAKAAVALCEQCGMYRGDCYCDGGGQAALSDYLLAHGSVDRYYECPFLKSRS